ncbi:MAG: excisionase family DNA-binding protein [Phycisphaerae bacterium]
MSNSTAYDSLEALAARLCLPKAYLRRLADQGDIPFLQVGRWRRFDPEAVKESLNRLAAEGGTP